MFKAIYSIALCAVIVSIYSCTQSDDKVDPTDVAATDRKAILTNIADNIVIPSYAKFKVKLDAMTAKSNEFTSSPNTVTLSAFRATWVEAYTEWQHVEVFDFGPGQVQYIRSYFNIYPASVSIVNANITSAEAPNMDVPSNFPAQGFPALDYLINGLSATDDGIVSFYTTDSNAAKRIAYLKLLISRMNTIFNTVNTQWTSYRNEFIDKTGVDANSSTSLMVNAYVLNYERYIRSGKFGIPSGIMTSSGGTKFPEKVEAFYKKDISAILAREAHQASVDFFNGKNVTTGEGGPSLKTYLDGLDAKDTGTGTLLTTTILAQFAAVTGKLNVLPADLSQTVQSNNQLMVDVYTEMQKAVRMLKVDMTSAMSITITYTDNDGD